MLFLGALSAALVPGIARAYQIAPLHIIETFDYGYMVVAIIWGLVFFAGSPDGLVLLGMLMVIAACALVAVHGSS